MNSTHGQQMIAETLSAREAQVSALLAALERLVRETSLTVHETTADGTGYGACIHCGRPDWGGHESECTVPVILRVMRDLGADLPEWL